MNIDIGMDELFAMADEHRMKRIENMIENVRIIPEPDFRNSERYLKSCLGKEALDPEATLLLVMLYNKRANEYHELAKPLARDALRKLPGRKDAFAAVFDAEGGPYMDWNCINHAAMIEFYKEETEKHAEDIRYYFWLLDLLIADCRTAEAREYVERMRAVEHSYHYEMYMGCICRAECDLPGAIEANRQMLRVMKEDWVAEGEGVDSILREIQRLEKMQ